MRISKRKLIAALDLSLILVSIAVAGFMAFDIASREYLLFGQTIVFVLLMAFVLAGTFITRYHLLGLWISIAIIAAIERIDQIKYAAVSNRLHLSDVYIAAGFLKDLDVSVFAHYWGESGTLGRVLLFGSILLPLAILCERLVIKKIRRGEMGFVVRTAPALCACLTLVVLVQGKYVGTLNGVHPAHLHWEGGGLRISSFVSEALRMQGVSAEMNQRLIDARRENVVATVPREEPRQLVSCSAARCPDIVYVHLESVFDPIILEDYHGTPGYNEYMDSLSRGAISSGGPLLVHTWGGASWMSEFALLCGVRAGLFGSASPLPHFFLAGHVRNCVPNYLKKLGYETHTIYTTTAGFVGVGRGFKSYGIDNFVDIRRMADAPRSWEKQHDKYFMDQARAILAAPSDKPRFIFISTNFNHGPHGRRARTETFAGPFNLDRTRDPAVADYVNRLNDTFSEMLRFERDFTTASRPVAILAYGDHHPAFPKKFAPSTIVDKGDLSFVTLYRFAKNYGERPKPSNSLVRVEELSEHFLRFAELPPSPEMSLIAALRRLCPDKRDDGCSPSVGRAIAATVMGEWSSAQQPAVPQPTVSQPTVSQSTVSQSSVSH